LDVVTECFGAFQWRCADCTDVYAPGRTPQALNIDVNACLRRQNLADIAVGAPLHGPLAINRDVDAYLRRHLSIHKIVGVDGRVPFATNIVVDA